MVALSSGLFAGASTFASLAELLVAVPDATVVAINLPTALVGHGIRRCDALVREHAAPHLSELLAVPPRAVIAADTLGEAERLSQTLAGPPPAGRFTELRERILELDRHLRHELGEPAEPSDGAGLPAPYEDPTPPPAPGGSLFERLQEPAGMRRFARVVGRDGAPLRPKVGSRLPAGRFIEAHAEASFRELAGARLSHARHTPAGSALRHALLRQAGIDLPAKLPAIGGVQLDELLDAGALAWTAQRYLNGLARSLPAREHWQLDAGRVVAIWL